VQVVLLAAGLGSRLKNLTESLPKTLLGLRGHALIDYIFASVDIPEVEEVIVVGGFQFETLGKHVLEHATCPVKLVKNEQYTKGSILTVKTALPHVTGGFLLMNADHIHPREMIRKLAACTQRITCACDGDRALTDDDMKVKLHDGRVRFMDKKLTDWDCGYIGMTRVPETQVELYQAWVDKTLELHGDSTNVERIVATMADHGLGADVCDLSGLGWIEVDNQTDLDAAQCLIQDRPALRSLLPQH
jgi:choline kinase